MVHLRSLISIPLLRQVTLTKKEKVLDPPSTVNSTRELNDKRQKIQAMLYFCLFPPTSHYCWNVIQKTEERTNSKKLVMKRQPEPNQHLVYFNPKEKQTSTHGRANTGKGDHLQKWSDIWINLQEQGSSPDKHFFRQHLLSYKTLSPTNTQLIDNLPHVCNTPLASHTSLWCHQMLAHNRSLQGLHQHWAATSENENL